MQFSGPFNSSYDGIKVDVLKSWMQKAIRRGLIDDALASSLRLFAFCYKEGYEEEEGGKWEGRCIFSNLLNRLIVIAGEDIGTGALSALPLIDAYVTKFREDDFIESFTERIGEFMSLIIFMCQQPKSRLVSKSKVFSSPESFMYEKIPSLKEWEEEIESIEDSVERVLFVLKNSEREQPYPFLAIRYVVYLHNDKRKEKIERGWPKKRKIMSPLVYKLWNLYLEEKNEVIDVLYKWYLRENENLIYLILATLLFIVPEVNSGCTSLEFTEDINDVFSRVMQPVTPPQWAVDKHTKEGRKIGKNTIDFALTGAIINNGWHYDPPLLEELYKLSKGLSENKEYFSFVPEFTLSMDKLTKIKNSPHGQLLTSVNKRPVLIRPKYVYKGPWKRSDKIEKFIFLIERRKNFRLLGTKIHPYEFGEDAEGNLWMRSPNFATTPPSSWKSVLDYDKLCDSSVRIIEKDSMGLRELHEQSDEVIEDVLFGEQFMYLSYIDAALLGVGDQCLRNNILDSTGKSYMIDWDDNTGRKKIEGLSSVFSRSYKKLEEIIANGIKRYDREKDITDYIESLPVLIQEKGITCDEKNLKMLEGLL